MILRVNKLIYQRVTVVPENHHLFSMGNSSFTKPDLATVSALSARSPAASAALSELLGDLGDLALKKHGLWHGYLVGFMGISWLNIGISINGTIMVQ